MEQTIAFTKKLLYTLTLVWIILFGGCDNRSFLDFEHSDISYQIYPAGNNIIRLKRTNGNGPYSLQLFDKKGILHENITMVTTFPFNLTKWNENLIEITYYVSKGDLIFFLPWFNSYKGNPSKIGDHKITYSYLIDNDTESPKIEYFDSFLLERKDTTVCLFVDESKLLKVPVPKLFVYKNRLIYYDKQTNSNMEIFPKDSTVINKFLSEIISIY